jgi:hypothetical protein
MDAPWTFKTDDRSSAFCWEIVGESRRLFDLSAEEAIGRLNRHWKGQEIVGEDIVYHELPAYWAHVIYYGKDSFWWITGEKREKMNLGAVKPKPYP